MTRSHHIDRTRFTSLSIMVFPYSKRVPPKSFVRSRFTKTHGFHDRDPQGLRRPRFSFFIFTCQTARVRNPSPNLREPPLPRIRRQMATVFTGCFCTHQNDGAWRARKLALAKGQCSAALSGAGYRPARSRLSTAIVNKSSHRSDYFCDAKKRRFFRTKPY